MSHRGYKLLFNFNKTANRPLKLLFLLILIRHCWKIERSSTCDILYVVFVLYHSILQFHCLTHTLFLPRDNQGQYFRFEIPAYCHVIRGQKETRL